MTRSPRRRAGVAAAGAASLLAGLLAPVALASVATAAASDLIISEYVEGSSFNKAVELYNGTGAPVDLSAYTFRVFFNGASAAGQTVPLSGTLAAGDAYVIVDAGASPALLGMADLTLPTGLWNGDDALTLSKGDLVVDSFGQVGVDPGTRWGVPPTSTLDSTLRRQADVCAGDTVANDVFDPALEWDGFATDTFDGLGAHTADCGDTEPEPTAVVINEFSASTTGTDVEYLEILGFPNTDYSGLSVLSIEGDSGSPFGAVDRVIPLGTTDVDGRLLVNLAANDLENGTMSLLLVEGYDGRVDVDTDNDGAIDAGVTVLDSVAVHDGGVGDLPYGDTVLGVAYDGLSFAPGGASRIPDGTDTNSTSDWVRNDFDLAGIPGQTGTLVEGEAVNTPGTVNTTELEEPPVDPGVCGEDATAIGVVQGSGATSPLVGQTVTVEGVVVGAFQGLGSYDGYYVQDAGDGDDATSDGIFVYAPGGADVAVGDRVRVAGTAAEFFGLTQISLVALVDCGEGIVPEPLPVTLPLDEEPYEGMLVTFTQDLAILEYFDYGRFGEMVLGFGDETFRQHQPTAVYEPGSAAAEALLEFNGAHRITLDDGLGIQNPAELRHPNGDPFALDNTFRGGDTVSDVTGVLDYRFDLWRVQPTEPATYQATNARPEVPEVGGTTTVASFNVLNYFTTLNSRGANDALEFERQQAKIVAAITAMDADVVGLIEIENNGDVAVGNLVDALNDAVGDDRWAFISTGPIGTDVITTALIYQPAEVTPVGEYAVLDASVDPRFDDDENRPALAQTFEDNQAGGQVTVVVNHLKSKGSACAGDPDTGQGNCNLVRAAAADALGDWANADPTGTGTDNVLIIGDLNSYDKEDPIDELKADGYTDLLLQWQGEYAYSYVFDGALGYLDYAMSSAALTPLVTGAEAWAINADEPSVLDYDMSFKPDAVDAIYAPDAFRSSDHDPILVGLNLDAIAPELTVVAEPPHIWPANGKWRNVTTVVTVSDDIDADPTVVLVGAEASGGGEVEVLSDTEFRVLAVLGVTYTFTYEATDATGNTTTEVVTVTVAKPGKGQPGAGPR
nr:ExeM/NucH family extracellular endonuclease [Ornithinimicrobium cerasi]